MSSPKQQRYDLIVIGGGAAGFFGAINAAEMSAGLRVLILEKSTKLLSKVKISGGGRCNVTHHCFSPAPLSQHYPRGQRPLKNLFHQFQATETVVWFEKRGVKLKAEEDGRMFPVTDDSQTIIDLFLEAVRKLKIEIELSQEVIRIEKREEQFIIHTTHNQFLSTKVLVAMGGHNKIENYKWLAESGHEIVKPIPSLFTFNDSEKEFTSLMGVAVPDAEVKIASTKFSQRGPVLITHWGLSGPAVIKLSAWAADYLHEQNYTFTALVNWIGLPETEIRNTLMELKQANSKKQITSSTLFNLPKRLWEQLCAKAEIEDKKIWADLPNKSINRLIELLYCCPFKIRGKTTFKEEFVTCGGVALTDVDFNTMESKKTPGLYFAGEVLNIDGETGGFNFQAAWTTSYVAAKAIAKK
ncbi:MAG TPA: NAD(P)/FAD-dependent oxidoreductase [Cyclobacteriaceae bacterium]